MKLLKITAAFLILLVFNNDAKLQSVDYLRSIGLEIKGGANYLVSDYNKQIVSYVGEADLTYFFPIRSHSYAIGLKGVYQMGKFKGRVENQKYYHTATRFETDYHQALGGFTLQKHFGYSGTSLSINLLAGAIIFDPKDPAGNLLTNNNLGKYNKTTFVAYPTVEYKIWLSRGTSFNLEFSSGLTFWNDNLDDVDIGANDRYFDVKAGFSFFLVSDYDKDEDGIQDEHDLCPESPEDFDGFKDDDGCPERDNDDDGIFDEMDNCPDAPEDFDGFKDDDGCPDKDNDNDGIIDEVDNCPDRAEDKDSFEDNDGCPDKDNDNDGVIDINDECPDTPNGIQVNSKGCNSDVDNDGIRNNIDECKKEGENYNFYKDFDGCPDSTEYPLSKKIDLSIPIFNENENSVNKEAEGALTLEIVLLLQDYSNTYWILEINSSQNPKAKAENLMEFINSKLDHSDRIELEFNTIQKNVNEVILKLNTELAKSKVINN